jgi:hypothetical protein
MAPIRRADPRTRKQLAACDGVPAQADFAHVQNGLTARKSAKAAAAPF